MKTESTSGNGKKSMEATTKKKGTLKTAFMKNME